jgi:hypothetical protein
MGITIVGTSHLMEFKSIWFNSDDFTLRWLREKLAVATV